MPYLVSLTRNWEPFFFALLHPQLHPRLASLRLKLTGEDIGVQKFIAELAVRVILFAQVNEVGQPLIYGFQFGR